MAREGDIPFEEEETYLFCNIERKRRRRRRRRRHTFSAT
jgi:hypothetical protein